MAKVKSLHSPLHTKYTFYNPDQKPEKSGESSAKKRKPDNEPGK